MNVTLAHFQNDTGEIKAGMKQLSADQKIMAQNHSQMTGTINGFIKAGKVLGVILTIATLANIVLSFAQ